MRVLLGGELVCLCVQKGVVLRLHPETFNVFEAHICSVLFSLKCLLSSLMLTILLYSIYP